mmetsp:Transcript_95107/g.254146  ORF Transcript_95107/g.254146 Transcript_95107/m.254146 type:complete len:221 (-) Transcript_95107:5602-6264(-)
MGVRLLSGRSTGQAALGLSLRSTLSLRLCPRLHARTTTQRRINCWGSRAPTLTTTRAGPTLHWAIAPTSCSAACARSVAPKSRRCAWETMTTQHASLLGFSGSRIFRRVRHSAGLWRTTLWSVVSARALARVRMIDGLRPPTRQSGWCTRLLCTVFTGDSSADRCTASTSSRLGLRRGGRTTTRLGPLLVSVPEHPILKTWMMSLSATRSFSRSRLRVYQ